MNSTKAVRLKIIVISILIAATIKVETYGTCTETALTNFYKELSATSRKEQNCFT